MYLLLGLLVSFVGTLPFGPINLSVVKTTVDYNRFRGSEVALAASLVEIFEALVAVSFGMLIDAYLQSNQIINWIIAVAFIVLAIVVFCKKTDPHLDDKNVQQRSFIKRGLLIALLNPQALPFWIFALAAVSQYLQLDFQGIALTGFLAGVFLGKFLVLYGFVMASDYLKTHLKQSSVLVNKLLAAVLMIIGLNQAWNALSSSLA